jgi:ribonuclease HI
LYEVGIEVEASGAGYHASLAFTDRKGVVHEKALGRQIFASKHSNYLTGLIESLEVLQKPSKVVIYSTYDELIVPIKDGWLRSWSERDWKSARGKTVRDAEQWKKIFMLMQKHDVSAEFTRAT